VLPLWSFQGAHGPRPPYTRPPHLPALWPAGPVSQNSTACGLRTSRSTLFPGEPSHRTKISLERETDINELGACRSKSAPASLERR